MITRIEYQGEGRRAEIDRMDETIWRVWVSDGRRRHTSFCRTLTSAQGRARTFIASGVFPEPRMSRRPA